MSERKYWVHVAFDGDVGDSFRKLAKKEGRTNTKQLAYLLRMNTWFEKKKAMKVARKSNGK